MRLPVFDMCQYGTMWRQPSGFMVGGLAEIRCTLSRCGACGNVCSRTRREHVLLAGASKAIFRTAQSQVYHWGLAEVSVPQIMNHSYACGEGEFLLESFRARRVGRFDSWVESGNIVTQRCANSGQKKGVTASYFRVVLERMCVLLLFP